MNAVLLLAGVLSLAPSQQPTSPPADPAASPPSATQSADDLPVSIKRIQRALAQPPSIRLIESKTRDGRPLYRVDIEGERIDITAILGKDFVRGPASYGAMTHQEFLNLVTPDDVKGYAAFSNSQGIVVAATSIALQWAVLKAIDELKQAKDERAKEQARKEVQDALEALRRARRAAGLPEK
jgi:DNA-binding transcriptional MocR family regulator